MYKLIIEDDEGKTTEVPIIRDEITVGRKEGNTIRLTERNVSRRHARISRQNNALHIEDVLSYNGIKVNGERIKGKVAIGDGDRIQIGDYQLSIKLDKAAVKPQPGAPAGAASVGQRPDMVSASPTMPHQPVAAQGPGSSLPTVQHQTVAPTAKAPDRPARLIVISTNFARQEFPLDKAAVVIGRTDENDVVLNHRSISRHHAKIVREGEHFHIVDMQSANGVRVNGEDYGKVELRKGDQIDLGHVRLIFVPPGQDIDIKDKIVDLDRKGPPIFAIAVVLLLLIGAGGGAFFWINRPPVVDPEAEAAKLLVDVEGDLQAKRWPQAIEKTSKVISSPAVSAKSRDLATTKRTKAEQESKVKVIYERFATAAGGSHYDQALSAFKEIPEDSVYRSGARDQYDQIFPLFVESHIKAAEDARAQGNCAEFQAELKVVLDIDSKQVKALAARDRPCGDKSTTTTDNPPVATNTKPDKPSHHSRPDKTEKPEKPEKPAKPDKVEKPEKPEKTEIASADVDQALTNAQTEFVNGNFSQSISMAKAVQRGNPTRAWRIIGAAACNIKDVKLASEAFKHLDSAGRQYMIYACQRQGITSSGSQFKLSEQ